MKKVLFQCSILIFLFACTSGGKQSAQSFNERKIDKLISEANIFEIDSLKAYAGKASKDQITKAKMLFFQGLDAVANKQNPLEGIKLYKESAQFNPDGKTYYYIANALLDANDTSRVNLSLTIASQLNYDQTDEISYTYARLSAFLGDTMIAVEQLTEALQEGFVNKKRFDQDKCFDKIRNLRDVESVLVLYFKSDVALKEKLFKNFLNEFTDAAFPLEISKDSICVVDNSNYITYDFSVFVSGMENGRFSRDVTNEYLKISKFAVNKNINAVIYKTVTAIVDTLPPVEIKIVTYDSLGNIKSELIFSDFTLPSTLTTGTIDENGVISLKHFKMNWKNDPTEAGYTGNERTKDEFVSENKYKINEEGQFVEYIEDKTKTDVVKK